jgi:hypothetical protein
MFSGPQGLFRLLLNNPHLLDQIDPCGGGIFPGFFDDDDDDYDDDEDDDDDDFYF